MSPRVLRCPTCGQPFVGDWSKVDCYCGRSFDPTDGANLIGLISGREVVQIGLRGTLWAIVPT